MRERCFVLVDGSNFYFKLKDLKLHRLLGFDFSAFAKYLCGNRRIIRSIYYVGAVHTDGTEKTKQLHANQQRFFAHLQRHKFEYSLGYLLKSGVRFHEKGVDVNIATDILVATYENLCDRFILVSSDTDLLPAIKKAEAMGKIVEYIGFSHNPSLAMIANVSESKLLKREEALSFLISN